MAKILIIGDSWGCGEWGNYSATEPLFPGRPSGITHLGLEQYLIDDGHQVDNRSVGGSTNNDAILYLNESITTNNYDYVFWFQTDPFRDINSEIFNKNFKWFHNFDDLLLRQKIQLKKTYKNLNYHSIAANTVIHCMGGCSKLNVDELRNYPNLIPLIPSVIEFLIPNFTHPKIWFSGDWVLNLDDRWDLKTLDCIIAEHKKMHSLPKHSIYFELDGGHPDRHGHKKIYEFIKRTVLT